jgi:hypothetical protein
VAQSECSMVQWQSCYHAVSNLSLFYWGKKNKTCRSSMSGNRLPKNSALLCFSEGVQSPSDEITPTSFCVPVLKWTDYCWLLLLKKNGFPLWARTAPAQSYFSIVLVGISTSMMQTALFLMNLAPRSSSRWVSSQVQCHRHVEQVMTESDRDMVWKRWGQNGLIMVNFYDVNRRWFQQKFPSNES